MKKSWLPILSLSFAAFIFVTSEFLPVGLLSEIANGFSKTESQTGILMTVYAWVVALLSLPLTAYVSRIDRKRLMLSLIGIFVLAHVFIAVSPNFELLMAARILVASAHSVFWAVVIPLGIRLSTHGSREHAMAIIATGTTVGSLLGIPAGTMLGQLYGWRMSFAAIGFCALIIGLILYRVLPPTSSENSGDFRSIVILMKRKNLMLDYLMTVIFMTGHFTAFTFISPFLQSIGGMKPQWIASVLLAFGCAGFLGSVMAPHFIKNHLKASALGSTSIVGLCLFCLRFAALNDLTIVALVIVWGMAFMLFNLVIQKLVLSFASDFADVAMAGHSGIYNVGIGAGALIGSLSSIRHLSSIGFIGAGCIGLAFVICAFLMNGMTKQDRNSIREEAT